MVISMVTENIESYEIHSKELSKVIKGLKDL